MKTHTAVIYHCVRCGNVLHLEQGLETPCCCGLPMVNAAVETIDEGECGCTPPEQPPPHARRAMAPVMKVPRKG